jgi:hypothetical protein
VRCSQRDYVFLILVAIAAGDHKQWPNAFFADLGLFTISEAHRLARQSR